MGVAELANAGKPSILVPYPWHKDQQQLHNAEYLANNQAAIIIEQKNLNPMKLAKTIEQLSENRPKLLLMGKAAFNCAKPNAAKTIATICEEVAL